MDDVKQGYRDTKNRVKEQARKIDGDSPADVLGNIGDDVRDGLGKAGDEAGKQLDRPHVENDKR